MQSDGQAATTESSETVQTWPALEEEERRIFASLSKLRRRSIRNRNLEEDAALCKELQRVRSQMNTYLPVINLPDVVLREIFLFVMYGRMPKEPFFANKALGLGRICRRWRTIALKCPTLWSCIDSHDERVVALHIQRCGVSDLHLDWHWDQERNDEAVCLESALDLISPLTRRFVVVDVNAVKESMEEFCKFFAKHSWNRLQTLQLSVPDDKYFETPIMKLFPAKHNPPTNLLSLTLGAIYLWNYKHIAGLQNLRCLDLFWHYHTNDITMDQFIELLEGCTSLRELVLRGQGPESKASSLGPLIRPTSHNVARLRCLEEPRVKLDREYSSDGDMRDLLCHLEIPQAASVSLDMEHSHTIDGLEIPPPPAPGSLKWVPHGSGLLRGLSSVHIRSPGYGNSELLGFVEEVPLDCGHRDHARISVRLDEDDGYLHVSGPDIWHILCFEVALAIPGTKLLSMSLC